MENGRSAPCPTPHFIKNVPYFISEFTDWNESKIFKQFCSQVKCTPLKNCDCTDVRGLSRKYADTVNSEYKTSNNMELLLFVL